MTGLKMEKRKKIEFIEDYLDFLYPDPKCELHYTKDYELLIAVMLSAQATDKSVNAVTKILFDKYQTLEELKDAKLEDIIEIIRPIGTYNRKAVYLLEIANMLWNQYGGIVPNDRRALESMPGIGRKVANVILSEWFHEDSIAVDTHVDRVSKRLGLANDSDSVLEVEKKLQKAYSKENWGRRHLQMVLFGRYQCKSQRPLCSECLLKEVCRNKRVSTD